MGFDPMEIPFLRMAHERGLGIADPARIEVVGEDISQENFHFNTRKSLVIWGDQLIRKGPQASRASAPALTSHGLGTVRVERVPRLSLVSNRWSSPYS